MPKLNRWQLLCIVVNFCICSLIGWKLAVVMVVGLAAHEYSHLIEMKRQGRNTCGFWLIPFLGGVAISSDKPKTFWCQAKTVLAGPIGGGIPAVIAIVLYWATGIQWLACAAFWISLANALNLIPMSPLLDGGKALDAITYSISRKMGVRVSLVCALVGTIALFMWAPIFSSVLCFISVKICSKEMENQVYEKHECYEFCSKGYLDKPFPITHKQMWMTALIWLAAMLVLTAVCVYVWHIGLVSLRLLLRHGLTKR